MTNDLDSIALRFLKALTAHLAAHDLASTVVAVRPPQSSTEVGNVQVWPHRQGVPGHLPLLVRWLTSMGSDTVRITTDADYSQVHLLAPGTLDNGTVVSIAVVLSESNPEQELLRSNVEVGFGAEVPMELLLSLVDAKAAESRVPVTAGTAAAS